MGNISLYLEYKNQTRHIYHSHVQCFSSCTGYDKGQNSFSEYLHQIDMSEYTHYRTM